MTLDELKQSIEQRTGVPASLLHGETAEENIAQAKALLAYKRECEQQRPKTTAERFAEWAGEQLEDRQRQTAEALGLHYEKSTNPAVAALEDIAERERVESGGYPNIKDGGELAGEPPAPALEKFANLVKSKLAYNPFKDPDGWTK